MQGRGSRTDLLANEYDLHNVACDRPITSRTIDKPHLQHRLCLGASSERSRGNIRKDIWNKDAKSPSNCSQGSEHSAMAGSQYRRTGSGCRAFYARCSAACESRTSSAWLPVRRTKRRRASTWPQAAFQLVFFPTLALCSIDSVDKSATSTYMTCRIH